MALFLDWQPPAASASTSSISRREDTGEELRGQDLRQGSPSSADAPEEEAPASTGGGGEAVVSSSSGSISRVQLREGGMQVVAEWQAHDLEAWTAVYDLHQVSGDQSPQGVVGLVANKHS
jgi:hypothetical protein